MAHLHGRTDRAGCLQKLACWDNASHLVEFLSPRAKAPSSGLDRLRNVTVPVRTSFRCQQLHDVGFQDPPKGCSSSKSPEMRTLLTRHLTIE